MVGASGGVLVVGCDEEVEGAIVRLSSRMEVRIARSGASAHHALMPGGWAGLIVDAVLEDGCGLDWLDEARRGGAGAPALVTAEACDRALVNRAFRLGARVLCKPCESDDVVAFADRLHAATQTSDVMRAVHDLVARHRLTPREAELLEAAVQGTPRQAFVASRGISINTYKTQVRGALRKIGACSLGDVRDQVLRSVLKAPSADSDTAAR